MKKATVMLVLVVSATTLLVAAPAQAGGSCPADRFCMYIDPIFSNQIVTFGAKPAVHNLKGTFKKNVSSLKNGLDGAVFVYGKKDAQGPRVCIEPNTNLPDLGEINDLIVSIKVTRKEACP